jgi:hypothetical protein
VSESAAMLSTVMGSPSAEWLDRALLSLSLSSSSSSLSPTASFSPSRCLLLPSILPPFMFFSLLYLSSFSFSFFIFFFVVDDGSQLAEVTFQMFFPKISSFKLAHLPKFACPKF